MRTLLLAGIWTGLALTAPAQAQGLALAGDLKTERAVQDRLDELSERLRSTPSATAVLRAWCEAHGLAADPQIRAVRQSGVDKPIRTEDRALLGLGPGEAIRYRRVRLTCGDKVLSEADNWYRPGLLSEEMNRRLEGSDTPFGVVAAPLGFQRRTLAIRRLFEAPPSSGGAEMVVPPLVLEHRALLITAQGEPLSLVVESYTAQVLADLAQPQPGR
ncbi:MAG: hypothetical protein ABW042_11860 [Phenylobacterium sp.]